MRSGIVRTGLAVAVSVGADVEPYAGPPCEVGYLCTWDEPGYTGARHDYQACGLYDVRSDGLSRVGSFVNNQTGDQVATFHGPDADGVVVPQYTSTAVDARPDTTDRTTWVVQPC